MHQVLSLNIPTLSTFQEHAIPSPSSTPPQILGWLSAIIWQLAGKTFFFFFLIGVNFLKPQVSHRCAKTRIIPWFKVIKGKHASPHANGSTAIPRPGALYVSRVSSPRVLECFPFTPTIHHDARLLSGEQRENVPREKTGDRERGRQ